MHKSQYYLLSLLLLIWLCACESLNDPASLFDQYIQRLARVLEHPQIMTELAPLTRLPRPRDRRYEIPSLNSNMLQFLSLYGCELQVLVGERNSILGKVMSPLNRLDYDLKFIALAEDCLTQIEDIDVDTMKLIEQSIEYKLDQLPLTVWNALWTGEEVANLLSYSHGYYPADTDHRNHVDISSRLALHLDSMEAVLSHKKVGLDKDSWQALQQNWLYEHKVGQLLMSVQMTTQRLNDASQIIEQRMQRRPFCFKQKTNPKAERMRQFFLNFYIAHIQTYVSVLHQQTEQLLPQLNRMAMIYKPPTFEFEQYRLAVLDPNNQSGLWQQFELAIKKHTQAWQDLLSQCGMRPG